MVRAYVNGVFIFLAAYVLSSKSMAAEYRLGPEDKVRIMVFEWRPSRGEAYPWSPLNSEFTVSNSGILSLPLIGDIRANSLTTEQVGSVVSDQLQKKMGLVERPSTSIEISKYRPFYVSGDVVNPGEFPFRPGLTVLKAVSLAGGLYRPLTGTAVGLQKDSTLARGDLRVLNSERLSLIAKQARLKAESLNQQKTIDFPEELTRKGVSANVSEAVSQEQQIFESRRSAIRSKIDSLNRAKEILAEEISTLAAKDISLDKQLSLAINERQNVKSLADRGLVVSNRQLSTEQAVAQMESTKLDFRIARVRAEQDRSKLDRDVLELQDQRKAEILIELRQTESKIAELREKILTSQRLVSSAEMLLPIVERENSSENEPSVDFVIVRNNKENVVQVEAQGTSAVEPGDVVRVVKIAPKASKLQSSAEGSDITTFTDKKIR